jgi:hypothetical protein
VSVTDEGRVEIPAIHRAWCVSGVDIRYRVFNYNGHPNFGLAEKAGRGRISVHQACFWANLRTYA